MKFKCKVLFHNPSFTCGSYGRPYEFFRVDLCEDIFESDTRSVGDFCKNVVTSNMALAVGQSCPFELSARTSEYFGDENNFKLVLMFILKLFCFFVSANFYFNQ